MKGNRNKSKSKRDRRGIIQSGELSLVRRPVDGGSPLLHNCQDALLESEEYKKNQNILVGVVFFIVPLLALYFLGMDINLEREYQAH